MMGLYTRINMEGRRFRIHATTFQRTYTTLTVPLKEDSPCFPFVVSRHLSIYYNLVDVLSLSFKLLMSPQLSVKHSISNPIQGPSSGKSNIEFSTEVISVDQRPFGHSTVLGNLRIRAQWLSLTSFQDEDLDTDQIDQDVRDPTTYIGEQSYADHEQYRSNKGRVPSVLSDGYSDDNNAYFF
jgi:hypothetical protein